MKFTVDVVKHASYVYICISFSSHDHTTPTDWIEMHNGCLMNSCSFTCSLRSRGVSRQLASQATSGVMRKKFIHTEPNGIGSCLLR